MTLSHSCHTIDAGVNTHTRARTRALEPAHTPQTQATFKAYCSPSTHEQRLSSPSTSLFRHSPAFPFSSSFSDLMSSSAQAPLGSTVNCGVSSHSR